MPRWGKPYRDDRDWKEYNEELVIRGMFLFDLDFADQWDSELMRMNLGKRGSPYRFPESFMKFLVLWKQYLDYRGLEGITRCMQHEGLIPGYGDYTTIWHRIHGMVPDLDIAGLEYADLATDGTGMKTGNAGFYRVMKYGDPDAERRRHLVIVITADARTKKITGIVSYIEGTGPSEPQVAEKHLRDAAMRGVKVGAFYGDGAFDTNGLFDLAHLMGFRPVIKIRKNAAPDIYKGSKYRRRAIREYRKKGYREWADREQYGMRWPGTEGIFSAVKRKFGENCMSRSAKGLEAEGYQRLWVYDYINQGAKKKVRAMD